MATSTDKMDEFLHSLKVAAAENTDQVKQRLRTMLPAKVIKRISHVSEHYMLDMNTLAMKIRFDNGLWSPALHIDDRMFMVNMFGDLKDMALNPDEFVTWCLMMYDAGDGLGDT